MIFTVADDRIEVEPEVVIVAGFTGRSRAEVEAHVAELRDQGVPVPEAVPSFYVVPPAMLTQDPGVTVAGANTSGEAEIALITVGDRRLVTLASDHTDRTVETIDIALSKRVCPKPIATEAWDYAAVQDHWDDLVIRSWIDEDDGSTLYQSGSAAELLTPLEIDDAVPFRARPGSYVLLTGTLPAIGPIRPSHRFTARLSDPTSGAEIDLSYEVTELDMLEHR